MLALRRLAAAQAHETRPLAAALGSTQLPGIQHNSLPSSPSPSGLTSTLHPRSSSSSRSAGHQRRHSSSKPSSPAPHQRRHSSSKPSNPPSDDAIASTSAGAPAAKDNGLSGARKRERVGRGARVKDREGVKTVSLGAAGANAVARDLPSVPATAHLDSQAVNLASFFSLHRPISVTSPVPVPSNPQAFAALFRPSTSAPHPLPSGGRVNETLLTLSSAARAFDKAISQQQQSTESQEANELRNAVTQASQSNAESGEDSMGTVVYVSMQDLAGGMRPFHPPPPPQPMQPGQVFPQQATQQPGGTAEPIARAISAEQAVQELRKSTVLAALRGRLVEKQRDLETVYAVRMKARRRAYMASLFQAMKVPKTKVPVWSAISVRRQRKLRMKKHKFKKLVKRQKNEKRRQDRL